MLKIASSTFGDQNLAKSIQSDLPDGKFMVVEVDSQALNNGPAVLANSPLDFATQLVDQLATTLNS